MRSDGVAEWGSAKICGLDVGEGGSSAHGPWKLSPGLSPGLNGAKIRRIWDVLLPRRG